MSTRIEDYAFLSDCHGASLVSREGSIDWLCLPRFDSGACFAALLGTPEHGRWLLSPAAPCRSIKRRYREGTLILETTFSTDDGEVTLTDFMPPRDDNTDIIRIVTGKRGRVPMYLELIIRFDYGSLVPWMHREGKSLYAAAGPDALRLDTDIGLRGENLHTVSDFTVGQGEQAAFVLTYYPSYRKEPGHVDPLQQLQRCEHWWREWIGRCTYEGPYREAVIRSLVTLKGLIYEPSGGIAAAATTSLPECLGGKRNWDYRFCWLRDSTFVLYALHNAGYTDEALAFRDWLVRAIAGKASQIQTVYGVTGERRLTEVEADWLPGYEGSRPVRIGNAACSQFQIDAYGDVMDAIHYARRRSIGPDREAWEMQKLLIDHLVSAWRQPDRSIWEIRGEPRQFTYSKVMAWIAMDRAVKTIERFGLEGDLDQWRRTRDAIHDEICDRGFNSRLGAFVQSYDAQELDASLLIMPLVGFLPADEPRIRGTVAAIEKHLIRDGLVARYATTSDIDGLGGESEGTFLLCSFWLADNWALQGEYGKVTALFEHLLHLRNDVGLLSEEYDVKAGRFLGNFPQAFSHVSVVNTAYNLLRMDGPAKHRSQA
jgi:GH15 family glucan-1,4-alpha-glucosidase